MAKARYAVDVDIRIEGVNALLRALNKADKDASRKLKDASNKIATDVMVPAYQRAASQVPHWNIDLRQGIRAKRDRIPSVAIGYTRPSMKGGASSALIRHATSTGEARGSFAPFERTNWLKNAKTYKPQALQLWADAIAEVVRDFNDGAL